MLSMHRWGLCLVLERLWGYQGADLSLFRNGETHGLEQLMPYVGVRHDQGGALAAHSIPSEGGMVDEEFYGTRIFETRRTLINVHVDTEFPLSHRIELQSRASVGAAAPTPTCRSGRNSPNPSKEARQFAAHEAQVVSANSRAGCFGAKTNK